MSAYPYNMFSNNLPTFTSEDLLDHMGLTERTLFGPPPFTWATKAFITRGKIAHGTSLPSGYDSALTTVDGAGVPLGRNMYWDALAPWVVVLAESDNLCTNAYVKISQIQCYVLSKRTGLWTRFGAMDRGYPVIAPGKFKYDYSEGYGPSTAIIDVDGAPCYWPWHTVGPEQVILHNNIMAKGAIDGEDFGGLFVICQSQLVHPPGVAFDATPHYALSLGADLYPSMDATISNSILTGRSYLVAVGGSAMRTIPSDGTPRMHYFITSPDVGVTAKDGTSIYEVANGATSMYMSNAELAANMPVLTPNLNIVQAAALPATVAIDISLAGGNTQPQSGTAVLSIDFTTGTPTEVTITRNDNHAYAAWPSGALSGSFTAVSGGLEFALDLSDIPLGLNVISVRAIYADDQSTTDRLILTIESGLTYSDATFYAPLTSTGTPTNGSGTFNFTRATSKNVFNAAGVLETLTSGNLAINSDYGAHIDPASKTNTMLWCRNLTPSDWNFPWLTSNSGSAAFSDTCDATTQFSATAATLSIVSGVLRSTATGSSTVYTKISFTTVAGKTYKLTYDSVAKVGSGLLQVWFGTSAQGNQLKGRNSGISTGTYQIMFTATSTTTHASFLMSGTVAASDYFDIDNISVYEAGVQPLLTGTGLDNAVNSCSLLTATAADATILQTITAASAAACSGFWVKRSVGTGSVFITRDGGSNWADITSLINDSTFSVVKIENTSVTNPQVGFKIATSGDAIIVDAGLNHLGTQLCEPIFTTTAAVTRNAEVLTYQTASNFSDTAGTILATFTPTYDTWPAGSVVGKASFGLLASSANSGVQAADGTNTVNGATGTPAGQIKIGCRWSGSSLQAFSADGATLDLGVAGSYDGAFNLSTIAINPGCAGYIKDVVIFDSSLSDGDIQSCWGI